MNHKIKILQIVKTTDGAWWAVEQVKRLVQVHKLEVHIVLPTRYGKFIAAWKETGAILHYVNLDFPASKPWLISKRKQEAKNLINKIKPDIIHSHFFGPTIIARMANKGRIPMLFQVPGPLHLENSFFKKWEISSASKNDYWIASSRYIKDLYKNNGISEDKLFLSYYGSDYELFIPNKDYDYRAIHNLKATQFVVGNVSYIYPPKWYLFQKSGLKNHELIIDSIALANKNNDSIKGLLFGGQWGSTNYYEECLKKYSFIKSHDNVILTGKIQPKEACKAWQNLDLAIHLPKSENCGGVIEPLLSGIPVLTNSTGGIPEVIFDGKTGFVCDNNPNNIAKIILKLFKDQEHMRSTVQNGQRLVKHMFDVDRTAAEVKEIYSKILNKPSEVFEFNSKEYLKEII